MIYRHIKNFVKVTRESELTQLASSMAFTTILSVVPFLALVIGVINLIGGLPELVGDLKSSVLQYLTTGTGDELFVDLDKAMSKSQGTLISVTGFALLAFTAIRLINDIDLAIRKVWSIPPRDGWSVKKILTYAAVVFLFLPSGAVLIGFIINTSEGTVPSQVQNTLPLLILALIIFAVYRFGPGQRVSNRSAAVSAIVTTVLLILSQTVYVWVTENVLNYNKIYGALAFLPLLLTWVMIIWMVFLGGVALNRVIYEHERSTLLPSPEVPALPHHESQRDVMSGAEPSPAP